MRCAIFMDITDLVSRLEADAAAEEAQLHDGLDAELSTHHARATELRRAIATSEQALAELKAMPISKGGFALPAGPASDPTGLGAALARCTAGQDVITQGDVGDNFYVADSGE